ncbi:hypothetical protein VSR01_16065 [Actinacidiphila sp. DG2A-62]|uniref:hypothetical protein n=1 Tax=Actinacidiphila sp. DG2A-62 TaxID=3108821 RepID=UPI002DBB1C69|nr:hypothetical protein [Actinacidiphila sp. DG2A-62]MEC3994960.1 hypothetical protein [Actinacidiphila sp. DG2A-62]
MSNLSFLPRDRVPGAVWADDRWSAVALPSDWGARVLDAVGAQVGPVFVDPGLMWHVWIVPPEAVATWPDASAAGVVLRQKGDGLLAPPRNGCHNGLRWLRDPLRRLTDPVILRRAIELVIGPLEKAVELGPVAVCRFCGVPTRRAYPVDAFYSQTGPGLQMYACAQCYRTALGGGQTRHLHAVRERPA